MRPLLSLSGRLLSVSIVLASYCAASAIPSCRNLPGSPSFPSKSQWAALNSSIDGRLVTVVPSAKYCHSLPSGSCTDEEWASSVFRSGIPGAMDNYNWEQDYASNPPSLCLRNGTTCGQGDVPVYAVNATEASHIQAGVKFAAEHNLRVAVKASGHDYLGRSTAQGSLLLWTRNLRNISFSDSFVLNGTDLGSVMTIGSGNPLNRLYEASGQVGKVFVGGFSATVVAAGGYIQGAGHSPFSPTLGLGADNTLEVQVVLANGSLATANAVENSDLFWAMRGGGAGSWGVIISATVRTYPSFNVTAHSVNINASLSSADSLMTLHARHIFDWDSDRAGQYFYVFNDDSAGPDKAVLRMSLITFFANKTSQEAEAAMAPLLNDSRNAGFIVWQEQAETTIVNELLFEEDVVVGTQDILGSRLIPASAYQNNPDAIGTGYAGLINGGCKQILGHLVAGGQVADNANISSAVNPKWRTAKTHIVAVQDWPDSDTPAEVEAARETVTNSWVPILVQMTGESDSGAYSNEADLREPNYQQTFFGPNYARLKSIKDKYDPNGLFIVGAGVGSEDWDSAGVCRKC